MTIPLFLPQPDDSHGAESGAWDAYSISARIFSKFHARDLGLESLSQRACGRLSQETPFFEVTEALGTKIASQFCVEFHGYLIINHSET
jgi:hypothetical protein